MNSQGYCNRMPLSRTRHARQHSNHGGHGYKRRFVSFFVTLSCVVTMLWLSVVAGVEEPDGYRHEPYDDVVPATLTGATRVNALEVAQLKSTHGALVVDVIPEIVKPDELPADQLWFPVVHQGIAGALWLPDVGYGSLSTTTENYFRDHLEKSTHGNLKHPIVFYCRSDCWMSWNAAKRAMSFGYSEVYWFADGINEWQFEDLEIEELQPAPGVRH